MHGGPQAEMAYRKCDLFKKNVTNLESATNPHIPEIIPKSIIVNYYLKGKKIFRELIE